MYFKNCEYFMAIADEGSVSKAAEKLFISQPSLSKYLKRLEDNLGKPLFFRDSHPMRLTPAGEIYYRYIHEISERERRLKQEFTELESTPKGTVSVGITIWRSSVLLPLVLP